MPPPLPPSARHRRLLLAATAASLACPSSWAQGAPADDLLHRCIDSPTRTPANRARDAWRHPAETLAFFGLKPEQTVLEVWPGRGGWWTEILAPYLRERGRYIAALQDSSRDGAYAQANNDAFRAKLAADPASYDRVVLTRFPSDTPLVAPGSVDLALTFRNLHNWVDEGLADAGLARLAEALRPGGLLGVEDHRARTDRPAAEQSAAGYVREDDAIARIERAGFRLVGRSEVNANPRDTKDHAAGVWTLPPTLRLGERDRNKYLAIGESDRFTLKFERV